MNFTRLFLICAAILIASSATPTTAFAHTLKIMNTAPVAFLIPSEQPGLGFLTVNADSSSSSGNPATANHRHCFNVFVAPTSFQAIRKKICTHEGSADVVVRSLKAGVGRIRLEEIVPIGKKRQVLRAEFGFYRQLKLTTLHGMVESGQCASLSVEGGRPPYSFRNLTPKMGTLSESGEFCSASEKYGFATLVVLDSGSNSTSETIRVRAPIRRLSMDPLNWNITYSEHMPPHPYSGDSGEWFFEFPKMGFGEIDYLTQNVVGGYLQGAGLLARMSIETSDGAEFDHHTESFNTSTFPAHVRFLLQRGTRPTQDPGDRWWSNPIAIKLERGSFELRVPLSADQWTNVSGQRGDQSEAILSKFRRVLRDPGNIGFTFGGGSFFGHGVRVKNGSARFILHEMTVED